MREECAIPLRNFLGSDIGISVARSCGNMKIAWTLGVCTVLVIALIILHFVTKKQEDDYIANPAGKYSTVVVPLWLAAIPFGYGIFIWFSAIASAEKYWKTEELNFNTSTMEKKDYLNYRVVDDRLATSSAVSLVGTGFIGSSALFGPFLRADR